MNTNPRISITLASLGLCSILGNAPAAIPLQVINTDRDWSVPGALTTPGLVRHRAEHGRLDKNKRVQLRSQLARVQSITDRYRRTANPGLKELQRIAQ